MFLFFKLLKKLTTVIFNQSTALFYIYQVYEFPRTSYFVRFEVNSPEYRKFL